MMKHIAAVLIAISVIASSIVLAAFAYAGGTENGGFPDREFILTKGRGDSSSLKVAILPTSDCVWWVTLVSLGGNAVKVSVNDVNDETSKSQSESKLTDVGDESEHIALVGGIEYRATLTYVGRAGISVLQEHIGPVGDNNHRPILITSDAEFTAENGVVSGSGTMADPYVIGGWMITATSGSCIEITDTRAHFEIRGVSLEPKLTDVNGLTFLRVSNGSVLNSVVANGWNGIQMDFCTDFKVVECQFSLQVTEAQISDCNDFELIGCSMSGDNAGLDIYNCTDFRVVDCSVATGYDVCWISMSARGTLIGNTMTLLEDGGMGIYLMDSIGITLYSNILVNTSVDIVGWGSSYFDTHTIALNNTVNGKPLLCLKGENEVIIDRENYGEVILVHCSGVWLSNMTFSKVDAGVIVALSEVVVVRDCTFTTCVIGVRIWGCTSVNVVNNTLTDVIGQAIGMWYTVYGYLDRNTMTGSSKTIYQTLMPLYHSTNVDVWWNVLSDSDVGVMMFSVDNANVAWNNISNMRDHGMYLWLSLDVVVWANTFYHTAYGLDVRESTRALIYHNDFLENAVQATDKTPVANYWDNGYPSGGNYWSNYFGMDQNGDGIGDLPYSVQESVDRYPLISPHHQPSPITTPIANYVRSTITNGVKITILSISEAGVPWYDVTVRLIQDNYYADWTPFSADLDGGVAISHNYSVASLGALSVCCWITDVAGNGLVNGADFFTLFTYGGASPFAQGQLYKVMLIYEPTGSPIGSGITWTP